jgi:drug/metabolite transporter (DMT)-like permease
LNINLLASYAATSSFVLLWGAAAIFTRWGLDDASPTLLLLFRFSIALALLILIGRYRGHLWPQSGTWRQVMLTGMLMIGGYSVCYFQAMAHGVTPGLIATIMGIQPILTLCLVERSMNTVKLSGLCIALIGLVTLVWDSLISSQIAPLGLFLALIALLCMTFGAILQKKIRQHPAQVLPLQYLIGLLFCLVLLPFEQIHLNVSAHFVVAVLFLGILISVVAQILLYSLLNRGNVVNVTSLFYLVPVITAVLDYLVLGNVLPWSGWMGMAAILLGIGLVFRASKTNQSSETQ